MTLWCCCEWILWTAQWKMLTLPCGLSKSVPSLAASLCIFALCFVYAHIIAKSCHNQSDGCGH
jgi:hypothetical protein